MDNTQGLDFLNYISNIVIPIANNMRVKYLILSIISLLLISGCICAQDKIHKRNQEIIDCKIKEIGTESIKYNLPDYPEDVLFAIDKDKKRHNQQ